MKWEQTMEILDWMTPRWPEVARWSEERQYAFHEDLLTWRSDDVSAAVRMVYEEGGRAPNGGKVIQTLKSHGFRPERDRDHRHTWAIVEYEDDRDDGRRLVQCAVSGCWEERVVPASEIRTETEIRDAANGPGEAKDEVKVW